MTTSTQIVEQFVAAEQRAPLCDYEFTGGGVCGENALPDSRFCNSHQQTDPPEQPGADPVPPPRPARRFRRGRQIPCTTLAVPTTRRSDR